MEVVRLVPVDQGVFKPAIQQVDGPEAILTHLRRSRNGRDLFAGAQQILKTAAGGAEQSFDAVQKEWVPSPAAPAHIQTLRQQGTRKGASSAAIEILELRMELFSLRGAYERLRDRVERMEESSGSNGPRSLRRGDGQGAGGVLQAEDSPSVGQSHEDGGAAADCRKPDGATEDLDDDGELRDYSEPAGGGFDATAVSPRDGELPGEGSPGTHSVDAPMPASDSEEKAPEGLKFPELDAINACLTELVGEGSLITSTEVESLDKFFLCRITNDTEEELGALFADVRATLYLGGKLMMFPDTEVQKLVDDAAPTEDSVDAMGEVCSMLSKSFKEVPGNPEIVVKSMEKPAFGAVTWQKSAREQVHLETPMGGRLILLAK